MQEECSKDLIKDLIFREMSVKDLEDVLSIEKISFPSPWTRRAFLDALSSKSTKNFVIEFKDRVVGYIMVYFIPPEAHIANFAIHPEMRNRGLGTFLLSKTMELLRKNKAKEFYLEVREGNVKAIGLYRKLGFEIIGRRRRYYRDTNEDALVMELLLP